MRLAATLLILIAVTHYGFPILAAKHADPEEAGRVWFYVLRGAEGAALYVLVGIFARRYLVWCLCLWGFIEEAQTATCQLALGITTAPRMEMFDGLCGKNLYFAGIVVAAVFAVLLGRQKK